MVSFQQDSPQKSCISLSSPPCAICPAHLIHLDFITRTILGEEYRSLSSSLNSILHSPVTSSLLGPNILLNTLFSNTLSLHSSFNVSDSRLSMWIFRNKIHYYGEEFLAPRPNTKLEDHPFSAVHDCLFNIFAVTLHIGGRSSIRNPRTRHAVVTGAHLSDPRII